MILSDYYRFEKTHGLKSKLRVNCTASTGSYNPFEEMRSKGVLYFYLGENTHTQAGKKGKSGLAVSRTEHISSIYFPDLSQMLGVGDMRGTSDALLFVLSNFGLVEGHPVEGSVLEVFVARGVSHSKNCLYNLACDGELESEMQLLRGSAKTEGQ